MIAYLKGRVIELTAEGVILETQGVGYDVICSPAAQAELQPRGSAEFWIYTHVREDALQLFGFLTALEKQFFLSLIRINGVGPKMALNILAGGPLSHLQRMIEEGDVKGLSKLPKVGKKTAEQMILALKGKLVFASGEEEQLHPPVRGEILSALVNLGYRPGEVEQAIDKLPKDLGLEEGIRQGLGLLAGRS